MSRFSAILSVTQLARLSNLSRQQVYRLLLASRVPLRRLRRKRFVFISDLKRTLPALWESICELQRLGQ